MTIYLDHNATTPTDPRVIEAMSAVMHETWGNPSSIHNSGQKARAVLQRAREDVAAVLGVEHAPQIIWTSGGTESNATALVGCARYYQAKAKEGRERPRNTLVISAAEHPSIRQTAQVLAEYGVRVVEVPLQQSGNLDMGALEAALTEDVFLVSVMLANNETGVVFPVQRIGNLCRQQDILFHTDAVNALGKTEVRLDQWPADFVSLSGHKVYGPRGIGVLVARSDKFFPLFYGGGQERYRRSGTENVAGAVGFALALRLLSESGEAEIKRIEKARDEFEGILQNQCGVEVVGAGCKRLSNTSMICFKDISSQSLGIKLDLEDIYVSSGAACASGSVTPSHVLCAMGYSQERAQSCVRFSFGRGNSREEIRSVAELVARQVRELRSLKKNDSSQS